MPVCPGGSVRLSSFRALVGVISCVSRAFLLFLFARCPAFCLVWRVVRKRGRRQWYRRGANAYALFNALTDFASRPPVLPNFRRTQHSIQMQAGRWLSEFDTLLQKNPQPDMEKYLGEYGTVAQWN